MPSIQTPTLVCEATGCRPRELDRDPAEQVLVGLRSLYESSVNAGDSAAQYWADLAEHSDSPFAPLAHVPGAFAALWVPDTAPATATTLSLAAYGFVGVPRTLVHFTTAAGARGIAHTGAINATRIGLFGPGVYLTAIGRPLNLFVRAVAKTPLQVLTPGGTVRILPYLVYVRWGLAPLALP